MLGKLPVPGRPTILITVGQGTTVLAVGAGGGCLDIFTLIYPFSSPSPCLWETARYRLKYCLKGSLNPQQPTNQTVRPDMTQDVYRGRKTTMEQQQHSITSSSLLQSQCHHQSVTITASLSSLLQSQCTLPVC